MYEDNILQIRHSCSVQKGEYQLYQELIRLGEDRAHRSLSEDLEQYLVRLLVVSGRMPEIVVSGPEKRLATIYQQIRESRSMIDKGMQLHELGFEGLKILGFFPKQAERRNVNLSYIFDMTQAAYAEISGLDYTRVSNSSELQAMVPLSDKIVVHLSDLVHVLWNTRDGNQLSMPVWPTANDYV